MYVTVEPDRPLTDKGVCQHQILAVIFAPANWIDRMFGGPSPVTCVLFELA